MQSSTVSPVPPIQHPGGIFTIDACYERPGHTSIHAIERDGSVALVDTGTAMSLPSLFKALSALGLAARSVRWVFVTHAHLDHAGGLGALMRALPSARAVVHPRAARHLAEPGQLEAATRAVYGDAEFDRLYGQLLAVEPRRIVESENGAWFDLGGSRLQVAHTPGHALHHHVLFDPLTGSVFTGDTFGLAYPELAGPQGSLLLPTTTPTQFDPEQMRQSIRRIAGFGADAAYVTHYGRVSGVAEQAKALQEGVDQCVEIAERVGPSEQAIADALRQAWRDRAAERGCPLVGDRFDRVVDGDVRLNAQGLVAWLRRRERAG